MPDLFRRTAPLVNTGSEKELLCAHSNYRQTPEWSEIKVPDLTSMPLLTEVRSFCGGLTSCPRPSDLNVGPVRVGRPQDTSKRILLARGGGASTEAPKQHEIASQIEPGASCRRPSCSAR